MLGVIIGVGAVITMLAITTGAKQKILNNIMSLGNNVMFIGRQNRTRGGVWGANAKRFYPEDAKAIQKECKHVLYASPVMGAVAQVVHGNNNWSSNISGGDQHIDYIRGYDILDGRMFSREEVNSAAKVCVVGQVVIEKVFNTGEPVIGQTIRIKRIPFKIVGTLVPRGSAGDDDTDDVVIVPYTTHMRRINRRKSIGIVIASATSKDDMAKAKEEVTLLMRQRHRLKKGQDDDFFIRTQEEIMEMVNQFAKTFTLLFAAVASISLLVGGIGIMNIMLVSVNERIREIGIRMALGAKRWDILKQFLIEALTLSLIGGILGLGFGYGASAIIKAAFKWNIHISAFSIMISLSFASAVGVFFGFYPAWKASKLEPIQALRHE